MNYLVTYSGVHFNLDAPRAEDVYARDIAWALSRLPRFTGHTSQFYSVAMHSMWVEQDVRARYPGGNPHAYLAALLHDAHEAYMGDIATPVARALGAAAVTSLKGRIQAAIHSAFRLPHPMLRAVAAAIYESDERALITERNALLPEPYGPNWPADVDMSGAAPASQDQWSGQFLHRLRVLRDEIRAGSDAPAMRDL